MAALYLTHDNGILGKKGEALSFRRSRAEKAETIPPAMIDQVMVLGRGSVTTPALHLLMENDVPVHFIDGQGRYKGSLTSGRGRGYAAKRLQFEAAFSPEKTLRIARSVVAGKILSQQKTLLRFRNRRLPGDEAMSQACRELTSAMRYCRRCEDIDVIRGLEGAGAAAYFSVFGRALPPPWSFVSRTRRPPRDPVNALLSFGYTMLLSNVVGAACIAGLDPCVGFLHPEYRGRPALALDLMEEFRSPVVDRLVASILNQRLLKPNQFERTPDGGVLMDGPARKVFLRNFMKRMGVKATDEATGRTTTFREHILFQARAFLSALKNDEEYRPLSVAMR